MQLKSAFHIISRKTLSFVLCLSLIMSFLPLYTVSAEDTEIEEYTLPWIWPVPGSFLVNGLDYYYSGKAHSKGNAVDIGSNGYDGDLRLDIVSATNGEVLFIRNGYDEENNKGSGWGNYVVVRSGNICIIYGHLQSISCKYGPISAGDVIGKMGNTGDSTGVHLHMQAYPYDKGVTDNSIYVFDYYLNNPLYIKKLVFRAGLAGSSIRYGSRLSKQYTALSGIYYGYSGSLTMNYGHQDIGAIVKSVRMDGARIYSQPTTTSELVETAEYLSEISVYGIYTDAYGSLWYLVSEDSLDKWVRESDVGFSDYTFGAEYENKSAPDNTYGAYSDLYFDGTVSVKNKINTVYAEIKQGDKVIASYVQKVDKKSFDIKNVFSKGFGISYLPDGKYSYEISIIETASFNGASDESKTYSVFKSEFTINSSISDTVPPLVENVSISNLTTDAVGISAKVSDNKGVKRVEFQVSKGSFKIDSNGVLSDGKYTADFSLSALNGSGTYTVKVTAFDNNDNSDSLEYVINIPSSSKGEVRKIEVSTVLNLRAGPGTGYDKSGKLNNGDTVTITEIVYNKSEDRYWGNAGSGWVAMDYAVYQSGTVYNIGFNLCGGSSSMSLNLGKAFDADVSIPNTVPEKKGCTFLGWSTDPLSDKVIYKPGDTYSENESVNLFAVWEDKTAPVISDTSLSTTEMTNSSVKLTVNASDNGGELFYSFDGGESYRRSNYIYVYENTSFPAGSILVKDPAGNVTKYTMSVSVKNIDKMPPTPPSDGVKVTVDGTKATFKFSNAKDDVSGVSKYTLTYSSSHDYAESKSVDIKSGDTVTLGEGVYYAKLTVIDKAGNMTTVAVDRFRIGEKETLATPVSFRITATSAEEVKLAWFKSDNADNYRILVADNKDFKNAITVNSSETSAIVNGLKKGKTYYAKVYAESLDGIYLPSDASEILMFEPVSSDNALKGFYAFDDAAIKQKTATLVAHYSAKELDLRVIVNDKASVKYYSDSSYSKEITPSKVSAYEFTKDSLTIYVMITAENGTAAKYSVKVSRAARVAETPAVSHTTSSGNVFVGDLCAPLELKATVSDGGNVSVVWYYSRNGEEPYAIANGMSFSPIFSKDGVYSVYAVVTNVNDKCDTKAAIFTTESSKYTVSKKTSSVSAICYDYYYNGSAPTPSFGLYDGDAKVVFKYYSDSKCTKEIAAPINAGTYYLKAVAPATDAYEGAESEAICFKILKLGYTSSVSYKVVQPSLRDRNGSLEILSDGVEYALNGGAYKKVDKGTILTLKENDKVLVRFAATTNYYASKAIEVVIEKFSGTDDFYLNGKINMSVDGEYLIVKQSGVTVDKLLSSLEKTDNIKVYDESGAELSSKQVVVTAQKIAIVDSIGIYKSLNIVILGDADHDGIVNLKDVEQLLMLSNGMMKYPAGIDLKALDIDGDGSVTSLDAAALYKSL